MGTDIATLGIGHRFHTRQPKRFIREIIEMFGAPLRVYSWWNGPNESYNNVTLAVFDADMQPIHSEDISAHIEFPECDFLDKWMLNHNPEKESFDFENEEYIASLMSALGRDGNFYHVSAKNQWYDIYLDNVDLDGPGYRWSLFYRWSEDLSNKNYLECVEEMRSDARQKARAFGCDSILYAPDQYWGEYIISNLCLPKPEFLKYIAEKRYCYDYFDKDREKNWESAEAFADGCLTVSMQDLVDGKLPTLDYEHSIELVTDDC